MRKAMMMMAVLTAAGLTLGCETTNQSAMTQPAGGNNEQAAQHAEQMRSTTRAVASLHPTEGNDARGVVYFVQQGEQVVIRGRFRNLEPGSTHGFHIHTYGDCTAADGTSAGGHYNPEGYDHGLPPDQPRHAGDLGNVTANDQGQATLELTVSNISVAGVKNPIIGRGVILHAQKDDGGQPTGNAGARLACGVIGVSE